MSYLVFARKWRPKNFDEVIGQDHIVTTLKNAIKQDMVAHAYLFCGGRGIGKTTTARLLAKALNCKEGPTQNPCGACTSCTEISNGISLDVLEIDGASNRGIDEIRNLRENVKFAPVSGRYKVYIIDEVHMLTQEAFNALLKTLEEPPAHVKFIFATTQPHKVLDTISSRCQRFDFRRIPTAQIIDKLKKIAKTEKLKVEEEVFYMIAQAADGSMRDAESLLDQLSAFCEREIKPQDIVSVLGLVSIDVLFEMAEYIAENDTKSALELIDRLIDDGKDIPQYLNSLIGHFRNLMMAKVLKEPAKLLDMSNEVREHYIEQAQKFSVEDILYGFYILNGALDMMRRSDSVRIPAEMAIVKLANARNINSLQEIMERINSLEKKVSGFEGEANGQRPPPATASRRFQAEERRQYIPTPPERQASPEDRDYLSRGPSGGSLPDRPTVQGAKVEGMKVEGARLEGARLEGARLEGATAVAEATGNRPRIVGEQQLGVTANPQVEGKPQIESEPPTENGRGAEKTSDNRTSQITLEQVRSIWASLIRNLGSKKMSVATFLGEGRPVEVKNGTLKIGFDKQSRFHMEVLERPANRKLIEDAILEISGASVKVELGVAEGVSQGVPPELETEGEPPSEEFANESAEKGEEISGQSSRPTPAAGHLASSEPMIQAAMEIFNARIEKVGTAKPKPKAQRTERPKWQGPAINQNNGNFAQPEPEEGEDGAS